MRAGALRYRLELYRPIRRTDRMGAEHTDYQLVNKVRAERVTYSGRRSEEVGEHFATYSAQFNIRDVHQVSESWQVKQLGGHLYEVVAIVPNLHKGFNTLICERVNE